MEVPDLRGKLTSRLRAEVFLSKYTFSRQPVKILRKPGHRGVGTGEYLQVGATSHEPRAREDE